MRSGSLAFRSLERPLAAEPHAGPWVPSTGVSSRPRLAVTRVRHRRPFDPTVLPALVAAGYDRSFELLEERPPRRTDGWRAGEAIEVDEHGGRARIDAGAALDLGGIGKGYAAARALDAMREAGPLSPGALVDLGGDLALWGRTPEGGPWRIDVADPRSPGADRGPAAPVRRRRSDVRAATSGASAPAARSTI